VSWNRGGADLTSLCHWLEEEDEKLVLSESDQKSDKQIIPRRRRIVQ
jgi:hypothetical protein